MSRFDLYPLTCTITTTSAISSSNAYGAPTLTTVTSACRIVHEQRRFDRADGTFDTSVITLYLPADATVPPNATITVDGVDYHVMRQRDEVNVYSELEGRIVWLG